MLRAPADAPKTVTLSGSPPNAAISSFDPGECRELVEQPFVPGRREGLAADVDAAQVAEEPEAVVDGDDHDIAASGEGRAVVHRPRAGAGHERAAVEPDQHRSAGSRRGPGVQTFSDQAVFVRFVDQSLTQWPRPSSASPRARTGPRSAYLTNLPAALAARTAAARSAAGRTGSPGTPQRRHRLCPAASRNS